MWNRIYLAALGLAVLLMIFLTYYSWSWLQSVGSPAAVVENYARVSSIAGSVLWVSALVLLIFANAVLWQARRSWALWTTLIYFVVFIAFRYLWLERSFVAYMDVNGINTRSIAAGVLYAVLICIGAVVVVFFNELIAVRLNKRIYPPLESAIEPESESVRAGDEDTK